MSRSDDFSELREIADAICDGDATTSQMKKLEQLLYDSKQAQLFYIDYVGLHAHMKASGDSNLEVVMRRSQIDEFIVRESGANKPFNHQDSGKSSTGLKSVSLFSLLLVCMILITYISLNKTSSSFGKVVKGRVKNLERYSYPKKISSGDYLAEENSIVHFDTSRKLSVNANSRFILTDFNRLFFNHGELLTVQENHEDFTLSAINFKLISNSKIIQLRQNKKESSILLSDNNHEFYPERWRPNHYWSFDEPSDRALDSAGDAHGSVLGQTSRSAGLLGRGAYAFNNTKGSGIDLGNGGGTALATGSFSCTDGVSIECLIKPKFSGKKGHHDDIFRKDMSDEDMRILLAFQNDNHKTYVIPRDYDMPALSFGLYLIGQGYHELKLPLDGKEGRPTLAELKTGATHHIVASYNVSSGIKSIYIDGVRLVQHHYPPGSKMVSGGSGTAMIGNYPGRLYEPFNGIIDEVAFYNFELPNYMIRQHYIHFKKGLNYYGLKPGLKTLPEDLQLGLPSQKIIRLDTLTGLPIDYKDAPANLLQRFKQQ